MNNMMAQYFNVADLPTEQESLRELLKMCWPGGDRFCPRCKLPSPYGLADGRWRCRECLYTFHDFSGRWLNEVLLSPGQWRRAVEAFVGGASMVETGLELAVAYNTAAKAVHALRCAILWHSADGQCLQRLVRTGSVRCGYATDALPAVFAIRQRPTAVTVVPLQDMTLERFVALPVTKIRWGAIVYTDQVQDADALVAWIPRKFCRLPARHPVRVLTYVDTHGSFWPLARSRMTRHALSPRQFTLSLKESEFLHNHHGRAAVDELLRYLCGFAPDDAKGLIQPSRRAGAKGDPAGSVQTGRPDGRCTVGTRIADEHPELGYVASGQTVPDAVHR